MTFAMPADESVAPPVHTGVAGSSLSLYWVASQGLYARVRHTDGTTDERLLAAA